MDSVRFGRALGIGARGAAKALAAAAEAAASPNPRPDYRPGPNPQPKTPAPQAVPSTSQIPVQARTSTAAQTAAQAAVRAAGQAQAIQNGLLRGGKRFGEAVWGPVARLSGVLWLEITGAFFGIFALFAAQAAWTHRADLAGPAALRRDARIHAAVFVAMALVFGYFCVSSFVRARRRERAR